MIWHLGPILGESKTGKLLCVANSHRSRTLFHYLSISFPCLSIFRVAFHHVTQSRLLCDKLANLQHGRWADRTVSESCVFSALRTIAGTVLRTNASHIADVKRTEHTQQPNGLQDNYENHSSKEDQTVVVSLLVVDPALHFECAWPEVYSHRVNQFAKDLRKQLPKVLPCAWYFSLLLPLAISSISRCEVRTLHMLGNVQDCPLLRRTRHGKKKCVSVCVCLPSGKESSIVLQTLPSMACNVFIIFHSCLPNNLKPFPTSGILICGPARGLPEIRRTLAIPSSSAHTREGLPPMMFQ